MGPGFGPPGIGPGPFGPRGGDLYNYLFGPGVLGGSVQFDYRPGVDHYTVYGDGCHFSWDSDSRGNVTGVHGTLHDPKRPW